MCHVPEKSSLKKVYSISFLKIPIELQLWGETPILNSILNGGMEFIIQCNNEVKT